MHADDADDHAVDPEVRQHRPARFQRGKVEVLLANDLDILPHQHGVAVKADTFGPGVEIDRLIVAVLLDHVRRQRRNPSAEPAVGLLQRDHIRVDLVQHLERPFGPPPAIGADRFAHIVAGHQDHRRS